MKKQRQPNKKTSGKSSGSRVDWRREFERYQRIVDQDLTGSLLTDAAGNIIACNAAFVQMFGFPSLEAARTSNVLSLLRSRKEGAELLERVRGQKTIDRHELEMQRVDGEPLYVVARIVGRFEEDGAVTELQVYLFNDTKRKRVEEQLIQTQKMESLGTLAGGIAHDFNNILGIVLGYANRLEMAAIAPEERAKALNAIKEAVERGATLVQQLLTSARQAEPHFAPVELNAVILETAKMLQATLPKTIAFEFGLVPDLPLLTADRSQLHQVLLNLCVNARDAMPNGGTIIISTRVAKAAELSEQFTGIAAAEYVHLTVGDSGIGIAREVRPHIFEPFFTTKERRKGTGLGLSVVYGVVNNHRGYVRVESEPGSGAHFNIYLPIDHAAARVDRPHDGELSNERAPQLILLVEDEQMLRDLGVNFFQEEGYRVLSAADGEEAVSLFEKHRDEIGLVICDLGLPKLNGTEVFRKMKEQRPGVRAIVASGYLEPKVRSELLKAGVLDTVQKPYDFRELVGKVRSFIGPARLREEHPLLF